MPSTVPPISSPGAPAAASPPDTPAAPSLSSTAKPIPEITLDEEVAKLCANFEIEHDCARKLDDEIKKRPDTRASDLAKLWGLLEDVGSPTCLLELKIQEMISGDFVGEVLSDREVEALALNFNLTDSARDRLNEMVSRRATKKGQDLVRLESILSHADDASETAKLMVDRVLDKKEGSLPDLTETEDVIRKFNLSPAAQKLLVKIVMERTDDSSKIL